MVLIAVLPPAFAGMILAARYHTYVEAASSTLIVTSLLFAGAAPMWIAIARLSWGSTVLPASSFRRNSFGVELGPQQLPEFIRLADRTTRRHCPIVNRHPACHCHLLPRRQGKPTVAASTCSGSKKFGGQILIPGAESESWQGMNATHQRFPRSSILHS
jgi:hypothetical protein